MIVRRGFTLVETFVALGVIVLLVSLSMPAIVSAKRKVKQARSNQQMKQIHMAIMLYADAEPGPGLLGFGLPPSLVALRQSQNLPSDLFRTGGSGYKSLHGNALYTWMPPLPISYESDLFQRWQTHVRERSDDPILIIDETYVEAPNEPFSTKSAYGVYLNGTLLRKSSTGLLSEYDVWR